LPVVAAVAPGWTQAGLLNLLEGCGDFEDDWSGDGIADHWTGNWDPVAFTPAIVTESPARGQHCQKVTIHKNDANSYAFKLGTALSTSEGTLRAGSRVRLSFQWRASQSVKNVDWKIWHNWVRADGTSGYRELQHAIMLTPEETWREWVREITVPEGAIHVSIGIYLRAKVGEATGDFWLDDARATDGRLVPPKLPKPMKTFQLYRPHVSWVESVRLFDGLQWHSQDTWQAANALDPDFLSLQMVRVAYILHDYNTCPESPFTYDWILANHPDWFLRGSDGEILSKDGVSSLDVGKQPYRDAILDRLLDMASRTSWRGLFLDGFDIHADQNTITRTWPAGYSTDAEWQAAVTGFLEALQPIRQSGIKLIANIAHATAGQEPLNSWLELVDGLLIEWGYAMQDSDGSALSSPWSSWKRKFIIQSTNSEKIVIVGHRMPDDWVGPRRFSFASYLCAMTDSSYFAFARSKTETVWHNDFAAPLGTPAGDYQVVDGNMDAGALIKRSFTNGLVVVNPTDDQTFAWRLDGTWQDLDGNIVEPGVKVFEPKDSLVLLKAPHIVLTISSSPGAAAPGEIVVYRVDYVNQGTATATNTYINAPVPSWTTFYSATGGGVHDALQGLVIWNLSEVPPGASGHVEFRVRVK
jgi:uncharacterized repeat protein (TIGR01451 family)